MTTDGTQLHDGFGCGNLTVWQHEVWAVIAAVWRWKVAGAKDVVEQVAGLAVLVAKRVVVVVGGVANGLCLVMSAVALMHRCCWRIGCPPCLLLSTTSAQPHFWHRAARSPTPGKQLCVSFSLLLLGVRTITVVHTPLVAQGAIACKNTNLDFVQ